MPESELLSLIHQYEKASLGSEVAAGATISTTVFPSNQAMTTLQVDRYNALNAYQARPLGNEVENRSQVVLPVVRDTMSWIMPQLMRMFAAAKSICRFEPENEEDEAQAELETETVNYVFMAQNNGVVLLHDFFWDALLLRNGYAHVYTREWKSVKEEKYTGLDQIELAELLEDTADEKLEVLEQREYQRDLILPLPQTGVPPQAPPAQMLVAKVTVFDVRIRRTKLNKTTVIKCLPPEEMRVSPRARDGMEDLPFAAHLTLKTRSDLIQDGFDRDLIDNIGSARPNWLDIDALARNKLVDQLSIENPSDFSMQELEFRNVVMMVDYDGDGVAELRRVQIAGDEIISNELIEETSFVSTEGIRMPHRHTGFSIYDLVMDLQVIQTNLLRAGLDNLTIANNLRIAVDWRNVNLDDLLTSRPHGPIRGNGPPDNWIRPLQMPTNVMSEVVPMLGYTDQLRSNRTGVGKGTMGLDADELQNVTKGGQLASMSAAALIVELMARMLAEGTKSLFSKIRSELIRNQDKPMQLKIRGKWTEVDPSSWRMDRRITPNVGLGSGNREELRANVQMLAQAQQGLAQLGLVGPKQGYETFKVMCEALGFNTPERFAMDPGSEEYQQHMQQMAQQAASQPQAPAVQAAQIRAQSAVQVAQLKGQGDAAVQQATNQRELVHAQVQSEQTKLQMIHEAIQSAQDRLHEAGQGLGDRHLQIADQHLQIILKLIPAIAGVLAAEKAPATELGGDVQQAGREIN
jgi:hypothetical protein